MINPELTLVVPSRGRPSAIQELVLAFQDTCVSDTRLIVAIDDDDPTKDYYWADWEDAEDLHGVYQVTENPRLRIGGTLNLVVPHAATYSYAVGFMGDDHRPRTRGWDTRYLESLRELGTGVVYGNDLIQGQSLPTQVAMTSDIVLATGHFVPDGMKHLWLDNAWKTLGERVGIRYLHDVIVEHMHPIAGKGVWDASYEENNSDAVFDADKAAYDLWVQNDLDRWVNLIREYTA